MRNRMVVLSERWQRRLEVERARPKRVALHQELRAHLDNRFFA